VYYIKLLYQQNDDKKKSKIKNLSLSLLTSYSLSTFFTLEIFRDLTISLKNHNIVTFFFYDDEDDERILYKASVSTK
jgi:hypothetical protein